MKNKFMLLLISGVFMGSLLSAQSLTPAVIASSGGYFSSSAGTLSFTVAEMTMVSTFSSMGNILTQGFQQPEEWYASVEEESVQGDFSVFPNPTNGRFTFIVNSPKPGKAQLHIYDMLGQKALSRDITISVGLNTENVDLSDHYNGIYFLEYLFTGNDGKKQNKVIKINLVY